MGGMLAGATGRSCNLLRASLHQSVEEKLRDAGVQSGVIFDSYPLKADRVLQREVTQSDAALRCIV